MSTAESFNGTRYLSWQGMFLDWFSRNAFGGTNYSSTPVGALSYSDEPGYNYLHLPADYFALWHKGKSFGICAWATIRQQAVHAVGDPLVRK